MADKKMRLVKFDKVFAEETGIIRKRRRRLFPKQKESQGTPANLIGLALSGGGIRSAVTNLGVLYEMSRIGLFTVVDYLSTVSGGGYIGACLASLLSLRQPDNKEPITKDIYSFDGAGTPPLFRSEWSAFPFRDLPLQDTLDHGGDIDSEGRADAQYFTEYGDDSPYCKPFSSRDQVFHLRNRASYLVPSSLPFGSYVIRALGAVSASTLLSLIWFFSLILAITTLYMSIAFSGINTDSTPVPAAAVNTLAQSQQILNIPHNGRIPPAGQEHSIMNRATVALHDIGTRLANQAAAFRSTILPGFWLAIIFGVLWGVFAPTCMHLRGKQIQTNDITGENLESYIARKQLKFISALTVGLLFGVLFIGFLSFRIDPVHPDPRLYLPVIFSMGNLAGSLLVLCLLVLGDRVLPPETGPKENQSTIQQTILSRLSWNRISRTEVALCTGLFIYCIIGSLLFAILPAFFLSGNSGFIVLIQAGLILFLRWYLPAEKKKSPGGKESGGKIFLRKIERWLMWIVVPVFILLAMTGTAAFLGRYFFGEQWPGTVGAANMSLIISVLVLSSLLACALSFINFNNISPHVFYKDRLAEAFLSTLMRVTSKKKQPRDFEKWMDLARNSVEMRLEDLHGHDLQGKSPCGSAARGPYLLINATLNLTAARDVQGFRRQSDNFLFSKCYTGSNRTGFLQTSDYSPAITLGRAMTISGASLTSVMGTKGSLTESFACTILGVRLGYWLPNPTHMAATGIINRWNWRNLYYELFRYTNSRDSHVYLSDGGHCGDNLGLLPLLQRRTKLIIASDAECDPGHIFDSLNNSIRRAYVDYNIKVHISLADLEPDENGFTQKHYAIGRILYPDRPWQKSWLLVIKNTVTGKESPPIRNYCKKSPAFPHETTADQFFTEEQFEVYRSLGREACREIWRETVDFFRSDKWRNDPWSNIDAFCEVLAPDEYTWDDIIRAIWKSEKGDFSSLEGLRRTIRHFVAAMKDIRPSEKSVMGGQLLTLHKWLDENGKHFARLEKECDIPKTWSQFKEIEYQVQRTEQEEFNRKTER